ncbi:MAG: DUF7260 family protein [Halodesulfurarchaeum sp.]
MDGALEDAIDRTVSRARSAIETEIRRTKAEREAFRDFAGTVRGLRAEAVSSERVGTGIQALSTNRPNTLGKVQEAYESSVMAVSHYEEEYGDTYVESLAEEFGPEIARTMVARRQFDGRQKSALLAAAADSVRRRTELIETLETEDASAARHADRLSSLAGTVTTLDAELASASSFGDYQAIWFRLADLESACGEIVETRQDVLIEQRERLSLPVEGPDVPSYVYAGLERTYPFLDATARILSAVDSLRRRAEHGMGDTN